MPRQFTSVERDRLAQLVVQGFSKSEMAAQLQRHPSTIGRELKRNSSGCRYAAVRAQQRAEERRRNRPLKRKMDRPEINQAVRRGLAADWSPDEIAAHQARLHPDEPQQQVSASRIYAWIKQQPSGEREAWQKHLRRRNKRPYQRSEKTAQIKENAALKQRPREINARQRLGDFEGDLVFGQQGTGGLLTLVDRRSRYTLVVKVKNKNARHVHGQIKKVLQRLTPDRRRSITFDNGTEFSRCFLLEKHLQVAIYLADPGCPYQRGTNENTNGLLRQYFPKGTDFRTVSHVDVRRAQNLLNQRPRACLDYRTPHDVFFEKLPQPTCDSD